MKLKNYELYAFKILELLNYNELDFFTCKRIVKDAELTLGETRAGLRYLKDKKLIDKRGKVPWQVISEHFPFFRDKSKITKHVLPLTYKPKIEEVKTGRCTQTIRPVSNSKSKEINDLVMFHGWGGRPYYSSWSWRTKYSRIYSVFDVKFIKYKTLEVNLFDDEFKQPDDVFVYEIARRDGFPDFFSMFLEFRRMYGDKMFDNSFRVIRWKRIDDTKSIEDMSKDFQIVGSLLGHGAGFFYDKD